jgi:hypothetical protein
MRLLRPCVSPGYPTERVRSAFGRLCCKSRLQEVSKILRAAGVLRVRIRGTSSLAPNSWAISVARLKLCESSTYLRFRFSPKILTAQLPSFATPPALSGPQLLPDRSPFCAQKRTASADAHLLRSTTGRCLRANDIATGEAQGVTVLRRVLDC